MATPADIPDAVRISRIRTARLPARWRDYPAPEPLADLGDGWARRAATAVMAVPAAVIPREVNYLLNPRHPTFKDIRVGRSEPFTLDPRL